MGEAYSLQLSATSLSRAGSWEAGLRGSFRLFTVHCSLFTVDRRKTAKAGRPGEIYRAEVVVVGCLTMAVRIPPDTDPLPETTSEPRVAKSFDEVRFFQALDAHLDRKLDTHFTAFRKEMADSSLREHEKTRRHVAYVTTMTKALWSEVFGKEPPGGPGDEGLSFALTEPDTHPGYTKGSRPILPTTAPSGKISEHDATLAGLQGQVIAVDGKMETLVEQVAALTKLQKEQMGLHEGDERSIVRKIADGTVWLFTNRAGRKFALTLIAALTSLITALGTTYALATGRLPLPSATTPALTQPAPSAASSVR
jgi:hypothetical protein